MGTVESSRRCLDANLQLAKELGGDRSARRLYLYKTSAQALRLQPREGEILELVKI